MPRKLIIMPNWIGDFVLALSVVRHKAMVECADVTLLVAPPLIPLCTLLSGFPVMPYKRKTRREFRSTIASVKAVGFDEVYVLPPSFSSAWLAFHTAIPKRRGISREMRGILLTDALPASLRSPLQHITYEYSITLETDYCPPEYFDPAPIGASRDYLGSVVFCPGAKFGPAKHWRRFGELAKLFPGEKIVLLGGREDEASGQGILSADFGRVENLIGKTSIVDAAAIIAEAKIVISNDSGLMHLAGFLGTPVVGIFGSTTPLWTRPLGKKTLCAKINCVCSPCFRRTCRYGHYNCLKNLTAQHVASVAEQLIKGENS
jgi:heptosyltransferase-2